MPHELASERFQRQHIEGPRALLDAAKLFPVPVAGGKRESGCRHAGRRVHVDDSVGLPALYDGPDAFHEVARREEGVCWADSPVRPRITATVLYVAARPGVFGTIEVHAVDAVFVHGPRDAVRQEVLPNASITDAVGVLFRHAVVFARSRVDEAFIAVIRPLGRNVGHLITEVENHPDTFLMTCPDEVM